MISVNILENNDVIQDDDWVRQLNLIYDGQSDTLATNGTYSGMPMNRTRWIPARVFCPAWIGKLVGDFREAMMTFDRHESETSDYEFVRGNVPSHHQEPLTKDELKIAQMFREKNFRSLHETVF